MKELASEWRNGYSWREEEKYLNTCVAPRVPRVKLTSCIPSQLQPLQGRHRGPLDPLRPPPLFEPRRSPAHPAARLVRPLPLSSSSLTPPDLRPGSFLEFLPVISLLSSRFHLVIPSQPGFAFSSPPGSANWKMDDTARVFDKLMTGLGYAKYAAQGGDWGSITARCLGALHGDHCKRKLLTSLAPFSRSPILLSSAKETDESSQSSISTSVPFEAQDSSGSSTLARSSRGSRASSSRTSIASAPCGPSSTSRKGVRTMLCSITRYVLSLRCRGSDG